VNKLLGVPKFTSGTEENTTVAIYTILPDWSNADRVKATCFDTTLSNIVHWRWHPFGAEPNKRPNLLGLSTPL